MIQQDGGFFWLCTQQDYSSTLPNFLNADFQANLTFGLANSLPLLFPCFLFFHMLTFKQKKKKIAVFQPPTVAPVHFTGRPLALLLHRHPLLPACIWRLLGFLNQGSTPKFFTKRKLWRLNCFKFLLHFPLPLSWNWREVALGVRGRE